MILGDNDVGVAIMGFCYGRVGGGGCVESHTLGSRLVARRSRCQGRRRGGPPTELEQGARQNGPQLQDGFPSPK